MADPKIKLVSSPLTARQAILASNRGNRIGLTKSIERRVYEENYFDIKALECTATEFLGLPYVEKDGCVLRPRNESQTTREYARVNQSGEITLHADYIFPGENGWIMRVIDNKFPLVDKVDFATGAVYGNHKERDGLVDKMDAKGKDFMILVSPSHIVPAHSIDFVTLAKLEKIFAKREMEDPNIGYVSIFSNNAGLPQKKFLDVPKVGLEVLIKYFKGYKLAPSVDTLLKYSEAYYKSDGTLSGASQPHPHARVISLPILPRWIEEGYKRTEENAAGNGKTSFHDSYLRQGLLIEEVKYFSLVADPVPEFNGGLLIIAKERQNIVYQ